MSLFRGYAYRLPTILCFVGLAVATDAPSALAQSRPASPPPPPAAPAKIQFGTTIPLKCDNPGTHQDVSKTPVITNISGATLPAGLTIRWRSTDNDSGSVKLTSDVAAGATLKVLGKAGNAYSCTADFVSLPDLEALRVAWRSANEITYTRRNNDRWLDAPPSVTRIEVRACGSHEVLHTRDSDPFPLKKSSTETPIITVPFSKPPKSYLRLIVDANQQVIEKSETNNVWEDQDSCVK